MKAKEKALIAYAWKQAEFLGRLQRQITKLEKRITELEKNTGTKRDAED